MRSVLAYTTARIVIFIATFGVLYLLGAKSWLGLLLAVVISGVISYVLLARRRDEMSAAVVSSARNTRSRFEAAKTKEDFEAAAAEPTDAVVKKAASPKAASSKAASSKAASSKAASSKAASSKAASAKESAPE